LITSPKRSAPPKSSSYSTFGSSFLTSFLGYYFLAGALSAPFGALLPELDPPTDPILDEPALIKSSIFFPFNELTTLST